jgi:hypothetical protein
MLRVVAIIILSYSILYNLRTANAQRSYLHSSLLAREQIFVKRIATLLSVNFGALSAVKLFY